MIYYIYNQDELLGFVYNNATYYYHKNILGDVIGILNSNYEEIVTYTYDAYGSIINIIDNSGTNIGEINPFRYRSYYYDTETDLYYLNSRYYNPNTGRFINADSILCNNSDFISYNLFSYVSNNPINNADSTGEGFFSSVVKTFVETVVQFRTAYAGGVGVAAADGPLPFGDALALVGSIGLTLGIGIYSFTKSISVSIPKEQSIFKNSVDNKTNKKYYFPENPNDFNPKGLIKTPHAGTGNGAIYTWSFPGVGTQVFRWDEDYRNGPHYHIAEVTKNFQGKPKDAPHYRAGQEIPEPYASIFFGN